MNSRKILAPLLVPLGILVILIALNQTGRVPGKDGRAAAAEAAANPTPKPDNHKAKPAGQKSLVAKQPKPAAPAPLTRRQPPNGGRLGNKVQFLTDPVKGDPLDIALNYVRTPENRPGYTEEDYNNPKISSRYVSKHNGVTHLYLRQSHEGIEVYGGDIGVNLMPDGSIINLHNAFVTDLANEVNRTDPVITAQEAIRSAATFYSLQETGALASLEVPEPDPVAKKQLFSPAGISLDPIPAKLMYVPLEEGVTRLAWNTVIRFDDGERWLDLNVDAETGEVLSEANWIACVKCEAHGLEIGEAHDCGEEIPGTASETSSVTGTNYNVFSLPLESPSDGGRSVLIDPQNTLASPFGWHDTNGAAGAEFTDTRGNNVNAQEDADNNNTGGVRPSGGASLNFNFPLDLGQVPSTYTPAVTANLFYWNNIIHDIFWHYGFDEPAGNFQENNYGNGGAAGDPVEADSQDGSGTNNANFGTPPDGSNPRMQMYIWTQATPDRDSSLDNGIIIHEYGHGISNRLTGGPANSSALSNSQSRGMGEGWSDFLGLALTHQAGDTGAMGRGIGTYVLAQPSTGAGIRPYRYSTDLAVNPQHFGNLNGGGLSVPHGIGSVWCTTLWELYWALVGDHGYNPDIYNGTGGNNIALQLVIDGMKLQPANPSFLDARDAILKADQVNNAGANTNTIWVAFAKRGMGFSAYDGGSSSSLAVTAAFDIPDDLAIDPGFQAPFLSSGPPGGPFVPSSQTYTLENNGDASLNWTATANVPWLDFSATSGTLASAAMTTVDATINANGLGVGNYSATVSFTNTTSGRTINRIVNLSVNQLAEAVDSPSLGFGTGGAATWFSQTATTYDGVDAAESGDINDSQTTWMETTITGPDTVQFFWKVDSQSGSDYLRFLDNGVVQESISGNVDWVRVKYSVPAGSRTLRWEYSKNASVSTGSDAGWVDGVVFASLDPKPTITSPLASNDRAGVPFNYQIVATKNPTSYSSSALPAGLSLNPSTGLISGTPQTLGIYPVDITATNAAGADTETLVITVIGIASYPFMETFESGAPQPVWNTGATGEARTLVTQANSPNSGLWHLTMDSAVDNVDSRNEFTLEIDLAGKSNVALTFAAKSFGDEPTGPPAIPFVGSADFDGVAISADGNTWYEVQPLRSEISSNYSRFAIDLDAAIAAHGISYTSTFGIRFNHFDNYGIPTDGFAFDDIAVGPRAPEIVVEQPTSTGLTDDVSTVDFGSVSAGGSVVRTFTVRNAGTADLTGLMVTKDGAHASEFAVGVPGATTLAAGASTTFDVTCTPAASGSRTAALHIASNDADENAFDIGLTGSVNDLDVGLDAPGLTITTGAASWFTQTATTHDGVDAAQSGAMGDSQSSSLQTTLTGPGKLTFWWKVSSEPNFDFLRLYLNNVEQTGSLAKISGNVDWVQKTIPIPAGSHTVKWSYTKDSAETGGSDAAWLDQLVWQPLPLNTVEVYYPNGGETVHLGSTQTISWAANITGNVKIDLFKGGSFHSVLAANESNDGSYSWSVSAGLPAANDYTVKVSSVDNPAYSDTSNAAFTIMPPPTLADALDATGLTWLTSGNLPWFAQTATTNDGADAARSGAITHSQSSSVETTLTGPGQLTFWWKVSSEPSWDFLRFYINGVEQSGSLARISGDVNWVQKTVTIPAGSQPVKWSYTKDGSVNTGSDAAWVDQVVYTPTTAPEIAVEQPVGTILVDGGASIDCGVFNVFSSSPPITFTVKNSGNTDLTGMALSKDGDNNADFTLGSLGATTLAPGASTTFTVTFSPSAVGPRTAAIHIASNDSDENPFDIALTGTGVMRADPLAVTGGPYSVIFGQSLLLDGSASQPSFGETITTYEWDLNNDNTFGDVTGATPAAISYSDLTTIWGRIPGTNTIQLKVTDSSLKTSITSTTLTLITNLTWDANGATAGQTNGAGAWLGSNQWWDGTSNLNWVSGSDATFGGPNTAGGAVTLASPTTVNSLTFNSYITTGYTLGTAGQAITLNTGITKNAGGIAASIISPITLGGTQTWTNNSSSALSTTGTLDLGANTLTFDGTGNFSFSVTGTSTISGIGGSIIKNGTGLLTLSAGGTAQNHTYTGTTTINGGTAMIGGSNKPTGNFSLNGGMLTDYTGGTYTWSGGLGTGTNQIQIHGASGFGAGNGTSTWRIGAAGSVLTWGSSHFDPTTLRFMTAADNLGPTIFGTANLDNGLDLGAAARTIEVLNASTPPPATSGGRISGIISNGSLIKTGGGNLILNNAGNTYGGTTTISAGFLTVAASGALGSASNTLEFNGGTLRATGTITSQSTRAVTMTATGIIDTNAQAISIAGNIGGAGGLTKNGTGTLTLSGTNTYGGVTTVNAGTLAITRQLSLYNNTPSSWTAANINIKSGASLALNVDSVGSVGFTAANLNTLLANISVANTAAEGLQAGAIIVLDTSTSTGATFTPSAAITNSTGAFGGLIGLTKVGAGILVLDKANTYTGLTTITTGTVQLGSGTATGSLSASSGINIGTGATFAVNQSNTVTQGTEFGFVGGLGGFTQAGSGTTVLNQANTFSGTTTISAGTLSLANALALQNSALVTTIGTSTMGAFSAVTIGGLSGSRDLGSADLLNGYTGNVSALTLNPQSGVTVTYSGIISNGSGAMTLTKTGAGTQILTGANSYTGATIVNAGTLTIGAGGSLSSSSALQINGGTYNYGNTTVGQTLNGLTVGAGNSTVNNTAAAQTMTLGAITRTAGLFGTVNFGTLTGPISTTTGNTNGIVGPWATTGSTTTLRYAVGSPDGSTPTNITAITGTTATANTLSNVTDATVNYEYSAAVAGMSPGSTLTGNTLRYSAGATGTAIDATSTLTLNGLMQAGTGLLTISGGPSTGGILIGSTGELVIAANAQATTISATIGGTGRLVYSGAGSVLSLSSLTNAYDSGTVINSGTVTLTGAANTNVNAVLGGTSGGITLNGGQLRMAGVNVSAARIVTVNGAGSSLFVNKNNNFTTTEKLTGAGTLSTLDGGGSGTLSTYSFNSTANDFTGRLIGTNTIINVNSFADSANNIVLDGASFNYGAGAGAALTLNSRAIELSGTTGGATVTNNNTTNAITINTNLAATGAGAKTLTLGGVAGPTNVFSGNITNGTGGGTIALTKSGVGTWALGGTNTYNGDTNLLAGGGSRLVFQGSQSLSPNTKLVFTQSSGSVANVRFLDDAAGTINFNRPIEFGGTGGATNLGIFVGNNNTANQGSSAGTTTGSTIQVGNITHTSVATDTNTWSINSTSANDYRLRIGTLTLNNLVSRTAANTITTILNPTTANMTVDAITMATGNVTADDGIPVLRLDGTSGDNIVTGAISNASDYLTGHALSLQKQGVGTWILSGTNSYTGTTSITAGTLLVNGSLHANSAVSVATTGTLGGTGTINGSVTVATAGNIAPGASAGILSISGGLDVTAMATGTTGKLRYELGANTAASDQLAVTGTLAIGSGVLGFSDFVFTNLPGGPQNGVYTLITSGGISGTLAAANSGTIGVGGTGTLSISGNNIVLTVTDLAGDGTAPTLTSIGDNKSGGPVAINTLITYTVTFSEDIDSTTVSAADFDNNGTAPITIGSIAETASNSGVFTVQVTPTNSGTLNLRIPTGAVVKDVAGNNLVVPVSDNTTITVQTPYETWSLGGAFNADANGDGVNNGLAWLLGAANPNDNATGLLPVVTQSGGNLVLTFDCLAGDARGTAVLNVQHSSDLGIADVWASASVPPTATTTTVNNVHFVVTDPAPVGGLLRVEATIPQSQSASGKLYGRLKGQP